MSLVTNIGGLTQSSGTGVILQRALVGPTSERRVNRPLSESVLAQLRANPAVKFARPVEFRS